MTAIYGHRGAMGTHPENTLVSFKEALMLGVDGLELDIQITKDGYLVVIHDQTVDRTTDGSGFVHEMSLEEIKMLHAGTVDGKERCSFVPVPTLEEVLECAASYGVEVNIELKPNLAERAGIEETILATVKPFQQKFKIIYSSFHLPLIMRIKELDQEAVIAWLLEQDVPYPADYLKTFQLETFHISKKIALKQSNYFEQTELIKNVRVWTVNEESEIKALLKKGVAAIMTDFPARAIALRDQKL